MIVEQLPQVMTSAAFDFSSISKLILGCAGWFSIELPCVEIDSLKRGFGGGIRVVFLSGEKSNSSNMLLKKVMRLAPN